MYRTPAIDRHDLRRRLAVLVHESEATSRGEHARPSRWITTALSVANLDAWIAKLRAENVTFLEQPYKVGEYARRHDRRPEPRGDRAD